MNDKPNFKVCVICRLPYEGFGNNPEPVKQYAEGRCCDKCNLRKVIPARMALSNI